MGHKLTDTEMYFVSWGSTTLNYELLNYVDIDPQKVFGQVDWWIV